MHSDQLREHGGLPGVRDENVLESALARPQQKWHDDPAADLPMLAATYGFGLVKGHPYRDGNKRIGFLAMVTFLSINGHELGAPNGEAVAEFLALADSSASENDLVDWIRTHTAKAQ